MSKIVTSGKRFLKDDVWHDATGPIDGYPDQWHPPMTEAEKHEAALSDPDCQPLTAEQLARPPQRVARAKFIRQRLGMSQEAFAERFRIPLGTLRDWEQHRAEPDQAARAYLVVIEREHEAVERALAHVAA
jgi:putative transcriptional regulator